MPTSPILHNGPLTSPSPWYSSTMHAIPPCPSTIMMSNLFTLKRHCRPLSLHMYCALYYIILQCLPPSFLYAPTPIIKCSHNNSGFFPMPFLLIDYIDTIAIGDFTTLYPNVCIAQFKGPTLLVGCLSKLHVIRLVIKITCRRSYFLLASLDPWITSGRSFFGPFFKATKCTILFFFIATFIGLVRVFNILHLPKWFKLPLLD